MQVYADPQHTLTDATRAMFATEFAPTYVHVRNFIEGGLEMFFEEEQMANMMLCSKMLERTQSAFDLAYYEVTDGADVRTMLKGGYRAFLGMQDLFGTIACYWQALDLGAFTVFFDQMNSIGDRDFLTLMSAATQSFQDATDLWAQGYYYEAGEYFAKNLIELTGGPIETEPLFNDPVIDAIMKTDQLDKAIEAEEQYLLSQKVAGVVDGFIYALTGEQSPDYLAACVTDQKRIAADVDEAYMLIRTRHADNVVAGATRIADLMARMPRYLSSCPSGRTHGADFRTWSQAISPAKVQSNFVALNNQMNVEFAKAQYDFVNEQFWEFGEELGAILRILSQ